MPRRTIPSSMIAQTAATPEGVNTTVRRLLAEAQALSARLAALNEVTVAMQRTPDTNTVLQVMADQARWLLDFQRCTIVSSEAHGLQQRVLRSTADASDDQVVTHRPAIERVLRQGYALNQASIPAADDPPPGMSAALVLPLFDREEVIGTLNFYTSAYKQYTQDDLRIATALAMQVSAILQNARLIVAVTHARDELHTILESIGDGVLVLDLAGNILLVNRALRTMLPQFAHDIVGQSFVAMLALPPDEQAVVPQHIAQMVQKQIIALLDDNGQSNERSGVVELHDGRHLAWVGTPLRKTGRIEGVVLTLRDVTAQVELERLREDMVRMLVHDFRTPLSSISMGIELISAYEREGASDQHAIMVDVVRGAAGRLIEQINLLLDVSKLEAGRLELDREPIALLSLGKAALKAITPLARGSHQQLELAFCEDIPEIEADEDLLRRVLDNLLSNACKFTPHGGRVVLGAYRNVEKDEIEIWVRDTGPGVPEHEQERIFEKYGQLRSTRRRSGTGLGLTFCRLVVEAHGGQIGVRNAPSGGSIFWFTLPLSG